MLFEVKVGGVGRDASSKMFSSDGLYSDDNPALLDVLLHSPDSLDPALLDVLLSVSVTLRSFLFEGGGSDVSVGDPPGVEEDERLG